MSGIAGVVTFDPEMPEPADLLAAMGDALAGCGPDDLHLASHRGAAMIYRALHLTAESRLVRQPLLTADSLLISWDGRLDNREDLQRRLGLRVEATRPDVHLVAQAYRRWGELFLEPLVGDFAVAIWDGPRRRLLLARDPFGARPLYLVPRSRSVLWASTPSALLATGEIDPQVDDAWVAGFLTNAQWAEESPFATIEVVPPGSAVVFEPRGRRRRRFWQLDSRREVRYRDDASYEEAFREHFYDAVRARLRVEGTVCCELSGGLDSSSIVCAVDALLREGRVDASEMVTYSLVYDRAASSDEREFIRPVEARTGREAWHILEDEHPILTGFHQVKTDLPTFWQTWPTARQKAFEVMRRRGARVLLSGAGGDHLLWSQISVPFHLADAAARFQLRRLWRELGPWHRRSRLPYPRLLWEAIAKPLWRTARGRGATALPFEFSWLSDRLRSRLPYYLARGLESRRVGFLLPAQRTRREVLSAAVNDRSFIADEIDQGFQMSCPFLHRPLVEFCLAVPFEQLVRPHQTRSLHRRALRGLLPETIVDRRTKSGPGEAILRAFRREAPVILALFEDPEARVYARGYLHRQRMLDHIEKIRHGLVGDHAILLRALQVEGWLRSLEELTARRPPARQPRRPSAALATPPLPASRPGAATAQSERQPGLVGLGI